MSTTAIAIWARSTRYVQSGKLPAEKAVNSNCVERHCTVYLDRRRARAKVASCTNFKLRNYLHFSENKFTVPEVGYPKFGYEGFKVLLYVDPTKHPCIINMCFEILWLKILRVLPEPPSNDLQMTHAASACGLPALSFYAPVIWKKLTIKFVNIFINLCQHNFKAILNPTNTKSKSNEHSMTSHNIRMQQISIV